MVKRGFLQQKSGNSSLLIQIRQRHDWNYWRALSTNSAIWPTAAAVEAVVVKEKYDRSTLLSKNANEGKLQTDELDFVANTSRSRNRSKKGMTVESSCSATASLPVHSVYAAREINTVAVLSRVFGQSKYETSQHKFGRMSVTIELPPSDDNQARYVVVFRFGAVVFFNIATKDAKVLLEEIKYTPHCSVDPVPNGFEQRERFDIQLLLENSDHEDAPPIVDSDAVRVTHLDFYNVAVISTVMGQTVALDAFNVIVDELLRSFASINTRVTQTGSIGSLERDALFKLVAQNNSLSIDMVSKFGLKDRSDTAWNLSQYDAVYQGMKEEFEIDYRFDDVEFKLDIIQQNAKFFLEILHNQKSNSLEWIIIGLISLECCLMCLDMSGLGATIMSIK